MFCIAAFIVLAILGIFSASHRKLAKQAWHCVIRRVTLKPCDINFSEELKGRILGKLIVRKPRLAKFLHKWFDWIAFLFVILTIWSLISAFFAGLNLWVYDTCDPASGESCSLSGEACGINKQTLSFFDAVGQNRLGQWASDSWNNFGETLSRIPDRLKSWKAEDYLSPSATFFEVFDKNKGYALEILDPSCIYCKKLFLNIKNAAFEKKYNFSYVLYPIPDSKSSNGYKFPNSYLMASYIEASKQVPLNKAVRPPDWQLLEKIFMEQDSDHIDWQPKFSQLFTSKEAENALKKILQQIGYTPAEIGQISKIAHSEKVKNSLLQQKNIVENKVKTLKIPTIIFNGRRFDRVIDSNALR